MTRCTHCLTAATITAGRVHVPHLSWCPRAPRPPAPIPLEIALAPDPDEVWAQLEAKAAALTRDPDPALAERRRLRNQDTQRRARAAVRDRLDQLGTTNAAVRAWGLATGRVRATHGPVSRALIEQWAQAHPVSSHGR